jgi:hypothetical protein
MNKYKIMKCSTYVLPSNEKCGYKFNLCNTAYVISIEDANRLNEENRKEAAKKVIGDGRCARMESMLNLL